MNQQPPSLFCWCTGVVQQHYRVASSNLHCCDRRVGYPQTPGVRGVNSVDTGVGSPRRQAMEFVDGSVAHSDLATPPEMRNTDVGRIVKGDTCLRHDAGTVNSEGSDDDATALPVPSRSHETRSRVEISASSVRDLRDDPNPSLKHDSAVTLQVMFGIPHRESLVHDCSCALQKQILVQGRLYIFESFVCFFSSIFGTRHHSQPDQTNSNAYAGCPNALTHMSHAVP